MAEVIQIDEATWRFEDGAVRFFLLEGAERALLIDSGMNCPDAKAQAQAVTRLPLQLLNTHGDPDHTSGNTAFGSFLMGGAEHAYYRSFCLEGRLEPVREGDVIDLGGRPLEIFEIPGHTPGSIAILDVNRRILYAGDTVQDGTIFMFGEGRDMRRYRDSLLKLQTLADRFDVIHPSHGTIPVGTDLIGKLIDGAEQIIAGTATGRPVEALGIKALLVEFPYAGFLRPLPQG